MKKYQRFISKLYIKNFLLFFISLELFFVGIDLLQNLKDISSSANLQILYTVNQLLYYVNFTLPLSLIFAMLLTVFNILKGNELVALYSLGISKNGVIKPMFIISLIVVSIYIMLNFIPDFVYSYEKSKNIKKYNTLHKATENLFLKSHNTYAYIKTLYPIEKRGEDIRVFITKESKLVEVLEAKEAIFKDNYWILKDIVSTKLMVTDSNLSSQKLIVLKLDSKEIFHGFKPKIINTLFKKRSKLTIQDSISAIKFLNKQSINSDKIRSNFYVMIFFPLFAPIVIYGLFFPLPAQRRGSNIALINTLYISIVLSLWGILFAFSKIAENGALLPEAAIILPIFIMALAAWFLSKKYKTKSLF